MIGFNKNEANSTTEKPKKDDLGVSSYLLEDAGGQKRDDVFDGAGQKIFGLYLPSYDETGRETSVVRSKYTALFENKIYKIKDPVIEIKNLSNDDGLAPKDLLITADEGEMNVNTSVGTLTGNVVIHLEENTQVRTESLSYMPGNQKIYTNDEVVIAGEKMQIKGKIFEVNLKSVKALIKENVEMEFATTGKGGIFETEKKKTPSKKYYRQDIVDMMDDMDTEKQELTSTVKADGELVFDMAADAIMFYDNVKAFVGDMHIFADQIKVIMVSDEKKISKLNASGNVLAVSQGNFAKGDTLVWDAETGITNIEDEESSEFLSESFFITSQTIRLYQENGWAEAPVNGKLVTRSDLDLLGSSNSRPHYDPELDEYEYTESEEIEPEINRAYYNKKYNNTRSKYMVKGNHSLNMLNVTWERSMLFKNDEHLAKFEGDVEVIRSGPQMNCEELTITFSDDNKIESLVASENVFINEPSKESKTEIEADKMTWSKNSKPVVFTGDPFARIKLKNKRLSSPKILIYDKGDTISADDKGNLVIGPDDETQESNGNKNTIYLEWQDKMMFKRAEGKASFYENIEAFKDGLNIRCDIFDVFFDDTENVSRIVALENVYLSSSVMQNLEALGTMLTWNLKDNIAVLTGDPVAELRKEGSRTLSKKVFFDIDTKRVTWEGQSHWQLIDGASETQTSDTPTDN